MHEEYLQLRFKLKLSPYRQDDGSIDGVSVDLFMPYDGTQIGFDERVIAFDLQIPVSLWDPPVVKGKIKSQLGEMFSEFIEGMEIDAS